MLARGCLSRRLSALRFISNYVALDGKFSSSAGMTTYLPTRPGRGVGPPTTYLPRGGDIQVGGRPIVGSAMVPEQLPDLGSSQILARLEPNPCAARAKTLRAAHALSGAAAVGMVALMYVDSKARRRAGIRAVGSSCCASARSRCKFWVASAPANRCAAQQLDSWSRGQSSICARSSCRRP